MLIPEDKLATFEISNIVFEIAPKINAAGRISHGKAAVELMVSDNLKHAHQIVDEIVNLNDSRREMDMSSTTAVSYTHLSTHSSIWVKPRLFVPKTVEFKLKT